MCAADSSVLDVRRLAVWFGAGADRVQAVASASLSVEKGESFGLVGQSGSGKFTVLQAVTGLAPNRSGEIRVAGQLMPGGRRSREFSRRVQMVFSDPYASLHPRHMVDQVCGETLCLHGIGGGPRSASGASWGMSVLEIASGFGIRTRFPAGSASAWRSRGRWRGSRRFCCWMSRSRCSMCRFRRRFSTCLPTCGRNAA